MILFDAHAHEQDGSEEQSRVRQREGIRTILSCGTPREARRGEALAARYPVYMLSAGVHPWHADRVPLEAMLPFMERAALVGEIGMDSEWCGVPLDIQRDVFLRQLAWASAAGKAVVLHTKGCEEEIARLIEPFNLPFLVHWYSGGEAALERFLAKGCYFTIGPDVGRNPAVQAVARRAPLERLLFETDGIEAVRWALGDTEVTALGGVLARSAEVVARMRGLDAGALAERASRNGLALLAGGKEGGRGEGAPSRIFQKRKKRT